MIKRITKVLNNQILLQPQYRFPAKKKVGDDTEQLLQEQQGQQIAQQVQQVLEGAQIVGAQSAQLQLAQQEPFDEQLQQSRTQEDPFEGIKLYDSNWKQLAPLIHTAYSSNKKDPKFISQVNRRMLQIQSFFAFDLNNLDRLKILQKSDRAVRSTLSNITHANDRYLINNITQNTQLGYSSVSSTKLRQCIQNKQMAPIIQSYRNNEYDYLSINNQVIQKIIEIVVSSNFQTQFLLNLLEFNKPNVRTNEKKLKSNKNFEQILHKINNLHDVNKLKFMWSLNRSFEQGIELINFPLLTLELSKVGFEGLDYEQSEKNIKVIYNLTIGKQHMKRLITYSLEKYTSSFKEFFSFWGLFNLLITRLCSLNQTSFLNPTSLNQIFQLFQINLLEPRQFLTHILPELLYQTKNKSLFEIYRLHVKSWVQRKSSKSTQELKNPLDQFISNRIQQQEPIKVVYNGWKSQYATPTTYLIRTTKSQKKLAQKKDLLYSQTKMIQHLIKGDYTFVLNHFLLIYSPGLDQATFMSLKQILSQAKENHEFQNQNARALYILKNINQKFSSMAEPTSFKQQYFTNFKQLKWLEKKKPQYSRQKELLSTWLDQGNKFSRKHALEKDPQQGDIDNKQKIRSKPKRHPQGALFSKKYKNHFCTQKDSYSQYRQVVKQVTQTSPTVQFGFDFGSNPDINTFKAEVQRKSKQFNQNNHTILLRQHHLPIVGTGKNLLKYLFLKKPSQEQNINLKIDQKLKKKLKVNFVSEIGALQKDYSQYLAENRFNFPLAQEIYVSLLQDLKENYNRKKFKMVISHMLAYRTSLSAQEIKLICDICSQNRIGITLIEIYSLIIDNKILMTNEAIYSMCDALQKFKKINNDIFLMTKKYCERVGITFQIKMLSTYVRNLLLDDKEQQLAQLYEMIKKQLKPAPYKVDMQKSAEQNLLQQKQYKQWARKQYNRVLFQIIDMAVLNVHNKLPKYIAQLFDQYQKTQLQLNAQQLAVSLIVYCNDVDKFLELIRLLKEKTQKIIPYTYDCAIKALKLNFKALDSHSQEIFNVTLFTHNFILDEKQIQKSIQVFKLLTSSNVFIKFLQYVLRYNPPLDYQIKSDMYYIMNNINDDFGKSAISGLLDFIYNSNRQKERQEFRKARIVEEEKAKLLLDLQRKDFFFDKTENQKERIINDIQKGDYQQAVKPKKNKSLTKQNLQKQKKEAEKIQKGQKKHATVVKTKVPNAEKRKVKMKTDEAVMTLEDTQPVLKKTNLRNKLRSKSYNNFEQLFMKSDQEAEGLPIKGADKLKNQPQKKADKNAPKKGSKKK